MSGLEGICPKCGLHYYGWALNNPLAQKCGRCSTALEIKRDNASIPSGSASFNDLTAGKPLALEINH
jgi:hypothetical protein